MIMDTKSERYLALPLGLSVAEVIALLGRPDLIVPRRGGDQWHYEGGRIVLTFARAGPNLVRVVRRSLSARVGAMPGRNGESRGE